VRAYAPGLVSPQIGRPGRVGFEVARRIRPNGASPRPAIIALTGWGQDGDRQRARDAGFDHHLVKPADIAAIRALLAMLDAQPAAH
jgi:CheY-like chemotaxis protein